MSDAAETGSLDMGAASDAFETMFGGEVPAEETQESAAERLAAEEAAGEAPQEPPADGDEQAQDDDKPAEPETVTIEVDGKPVQMTKEAIAEAIKGQMKAADYTQKTMALSEQQKAAAAEKEAAKNERNELAHKLNAYLIQADGNLTHIESQLTDELLNTDPVGYLALERTLRKGQAEQAKAKQDMKDLYDQAVADQQETSKNFIKEQHDILVAKLPEWKDPEKMKTGMGQLDNYLKERGYKAEDGMAILDARLLLMANDAMKYRDLMERASKASKKVVAAPAKVERTGTPTQRNGAAETRAAALNKLSKGGGKISDAAAAFASFM